MDISHIAARVTMALFGAGFFILLVWLAYMIETDTKDLFGRGRHVIVFVPALMALTLIALGVSVVARMVGS